MGLCGRGLVGPLGVRSIRRGQLKRVLDYVCFGDHGRTHNGFERAVFGLICVGASATVTGDPGYPTVTSVKIKNGLTTRVLSLESKIVTATGVQIASYTLAPARAWSGIIGTFR